MEKLFVTMVQMEVAGWETTAWLQVLSALNPVTHQLQSHVLMEKLFVTMVHLDTSLVLHPASIYHRWESNTKVWLLGFYSKTLNLDIRIMLADVITTTSQLSDQCILAILLLEKSFK